MVVGLILVFAESALAPVGAAKTDANASQRTPRNPIPRMDKALVADMPYLEEKAPRI